jgi:hypothetical protein
MRTYAAVSSARKEYSSGQFSGILVERREKK